MTSKPATSRAECPICFIAILISIFSVTLRAQIREQSSSAQRETPFPSSITPHEESGDHSSTSIQGRTLNERRTGPCSLRVPDTFPTPPVGAKVANLASIYIPLSARDKFSFFRKQTYSPYTFASAGFQATWAQAMGQWPHYGGDPQGWGRR